MPRVSRETRSRQWTERLDRFHDSGQSVREFCQLEGVSQPSFYSWKKKLKGRESDERQTRHATTVSPKTSSAFKPIELMPTAIPAQRCTTIHIADGVHIELGEDLLIVDRVVQAVLNETLHRSNSHSGASTC
jgi:transposase-like protein